MRNYIVILMVLIATQLGAQNNDYLVTLDGIGKLQLGMKQTEVEKMLGKKISLVHMNDEEGSWMDTTKVKYKNTDVTLYFEREYEDDNIFVMALAGVLVSNPLYKTKAGIGFGTDKLRIVNAYENNRINIMPDYEDDEYTILSKTLSTIYVYDDNSENTLVFHLKNKKVISIEVVRFYGD